MSCFTSEVSPEIEGLVNFGIGESELVTRVRIQVRVGPLVAERIVGTYFVRIV